MMSDPLNATSPLGSTMAGIDAAEDPRTRVRHLDVITAQLAQGRRGGTVALGLAPLMRVLGVGQARERASRARFFSAMGGVAVWGTAPANGFGRAVNRGV